MENIKETLIIKLEDFPKFLENELSYKYYTGV
jgi:hypothetical protein